MAPLFSALLVINNNCHDVATAMLAATGVTMWVIIRRLENTGPEALPLLFSLYRSISRIVTFSLVWIAAGAVPRILTFSSTEFADAISKSHLTGLMARHILSFAMTLAGAYLWISLIKRVKQIKARTL